MPTELTTKGKVETGEPPAGQRSGTWLDLANVGRLQLTQLLAKNTGVEVYQTQTPGMVVKLFDLSCAKADEISYGPYMDFAMELENFEDLQQIEELRPFVPAYYGANIDYPQKQAFIAMELIEGESLTSWSLQAAQEGYPAAWVQAFRETIYETLSIMRLFHKHGIILIDFKPDDIFRFPDGRIRFVDMGAFFTPRHARQSDKYVYSTTPDHAELLIDSSNVPVGVPLTKTSDIFSAGVALFEMATGNSRLRIDGATADEILASPGIFRFRDSQIRDLWRSNSELKDALPLIEMQLKDRELLFAELWHLLKGYVAVKLADWESLPEPQQNQIILVTGTTFILEQLPPRLQWLAGPIAQATALRSMRLKTVAELMRLLHQPASEGAREDLTQHNGLVRHLSGLEQSVAFLDLLNHWEVRLNPQSRHWAICAMVAQGQLGESAPFVFLKQNHRDEHGHRFYSIVDDLEADEFETGKLSLWHVRHDHLAWIGA